MTSPRAASSGRWRLLIVASSLALLAGCASTDGASESPSAARVRSPFAAEDVWPLSRNPVVTPSGPVALEDWLLGEARAREVWEVELGSESYAGPVITPQMVVVGTNGESAADAAIDAPDLGVLLGFDLETGARIWRFERSKLADGDRDWPLQGICSTPTVTGSGGLFFVTNRGELTAIDRGGSVRWAFDMPARLGVRQHFMSASSPLVVGERVFVATGHGPPEGRGAKHSGGDTRSPGLIAVTRRTGELLWTFEIADGDLVDGQWSSPTWLPGPQRGGGAVLYGGGDGRLVALDPATGALRWSFDGNQGQGDASEHLRHAIVASPVVVPGLGGRAKHRIYLAMGRDPEAGAAPGRLFALDALPGGEPVLAWSMGTDSGSAGARFGRTIARVAAAPGMVLAVDLDGYVHALDPGDGSEHWRYDMLAPIWATPLVVGDRVLVVDTDGDLAVLGLGPELEVLAEAELAVGVYSSPVFEGRSLFLATRKSLRRVVYSDLR